MIFAMGGDSAGQSYRRQQMRDLNIEELGQVYGAGGSGRNGGSSCGKGSRSRKSKSKKSKSKKSRNSKSHRRSGRCW
jgi:hypothetical protein